MSEKCVDEYRGDCDGEVGWGWTGYRDMPLCSRHWERRYSNYEDSIARFADSDVPPEWFDPAYAGERWEDDY